MGTSSVEPRLLTVTEVANMLRVSAPRVRELVTSGTLQSLRLSPQGRHRFRVEDVERLIRGEESNP